MRTVRMEVMKNPTQIRLYDIFRKDLHMPDDRAQNLVSTINDALNDHRDEEREELATKAFVKDELSTAFQSLKDQMRDQMHDLEIRMTRQIYFAGLIQFLGIVGAILAIYAFLRK
ncbi:MAG TPA: hypothetical protein VL978_16115 [Puia sp.]|nr:hypothetical protein [Puia sp.]